jgi:hypothetical protein
MYYVNSKDEPIDIGSKVVGEYFGLKLTGTVTYIHVPCQGDFKIHIETDEEFEVCGMGGRTAFIGNSSEVFLAQLDNA